MKKNLVLTGMMGVGKSSVGEDFSRTLRIDSMVKDKLYLTNEIEEFIWTKIAE